MADEDGDGDLDDALLGRGDMLIGEEYDDNDDQQSHGQKFIILFRDSVRGRTTPTHWRGEEVVLASPTLPQLRNSASSSALLLHDSNVEDLRVKVSIHDIDLNPWI